MDILENAKRIAKEKEEKILKEKENAQEQRRQLQVQLKVFEDALMIELIKLDKQPCKYGNFELDKKGDSIYGVLACLKVCGKFVAWIKAKIVSGTVDYGEGSLGHDYTRPEFWARIYFPQSRNYIEWDFEESKPYSNGGYQTQSYFKLEDLPSFFEEIAQQLSQWM
jgi:hypothetical protein